MSISPKTYDIVIVGAGPSGATLARLVSSRFSVAIIDRRNLHEGDNPKNEKCCGGLIAPDAQRMLASFGMAVPKSVTADPQLFAVRTYDIGFSRERIYQRSYVNINREAFDRWLFSQIPSSVDRFTDTIITDLQVGDSNTILRGFRQGIPFNLSARVVIGADGARSHIRRFCTYRSHEPRTYIALQGEFELHERDPYYTAVFAPHLTDFYGWMIPKNGTIFAGVALDIHSRVTDSYQNFSELVRRRFPFIGKEIRRNGAFIYRPSGFNDIMTGDNHIALVGEAAGFISPSSAEGFSFAFRSAQCLADSLNDGIDGFTGRYRRYSSSLTYSIRAKTMKSPSMYTPWIRRMILASGFQSL